MSFDTSNIPCSTQISVHNSDKTGCNTIGNANAIVEALVSDSQMLKIFILMSKENRLNICAILQDVNANFCIDKIEEFMNTVDYDCVKNRQNTISENLKFDVLIYGYSKRANNGIDFELLVNEQYSENDESKQAVCSVSRQLMESINSVIKSSTATNLMFCIECGIRMWNETDCRQHGIDHHKWILNDEQWGHSGSNSVVLQAQYENSNECIINKFTRVDWLDKQFQISMPFLIPNLDQIGFRRDTEQSQSSPSLSILPSWTTATSPCTAICGHCDTVFASTLELEEHTRINHQGSNTPINRCNSRPITATTREYRCNICNYKTVTKGNLHIHFQSEKHRNNQREHDQNEHKGHIHNQNNSPIPALGSLPQLHMFDSLISRAQNEFFSNIKVNSYSSNWPAIHNNDQNKDSTGIGLPVESNLGNMAIFKCDICHNFSHSDIEVILDHAERPRPLPSNSEVSKVVRASMDGTSGAELEHVCMLDGYKTRIKANFLLHFKTEKHQQKLQLLAHAGEGGIENANKIMLQMVTEQTSLISIHCSLCRATFSTAHKLRLHVDSSDHQINQKIANSFNLWKKSLENNNNFKEEKVITGFECKPCGSVFRRYIDVLDHFHVQKNSIHMAVFKQEMDINSLVKVHYYNKLDKSEFFNGSNTEKLTEKSEVLVSLLFRCNLCNDPVDRKELRNHFKEIHKIQDHCVDQFISLAEKAHVESIPKMLPTYKSLKISDKPKEWCDCLIIKETDNLEPMVRCQQCGKCFATVSLLEEHRTAVKHNDILDHRGHLCYKKGCNQYFKSISLMIDHFYEIHAFQIPEYKRLESYKYICKVCHILAFNCTIKCYQHMSSHSLFGEFDCVFCGLATEGRSSLRVHIENHHVIYDDISCSDSKKSPENIDPAKSGFDLITVSSVLTKPDCQSTFSSPESVVNKENRNQSSKTLEQIPTIRNSAMTGSDLLIPRINSLTSISALISTVGLENVKLVIETMINSKCDQNENDATVWKYAESIIDIANIKETLIEKCRECGKVFSSQAVLKKHDQICINPTNEILQEFERIVSICREHLSRMMLTFANDSSRKPLFVAINSHANENFRDESAPVQAQPLRTSISGEEPLPHFSPKFTSTGLLNINRSIIQPMINPYRFHPNNHNFLNILPPLGMFPMPQFRFRNLNSPNGPTNLSFFNSKPPVTNPTINPNLIEHQKLPDVTQKMDNINRKRTQIKNHQYDILRSYFNINNPPNDETIAEIIDKTGLDKKTVKHWFRNTLFKERQRCKDSPYNFNIPPETSLNVEEYEKTGKIEVRSECSRTSSPIDKTKNSDDTKTDASSDDYKIENNKRPSDDNGHDTVSAKLRRIMENKDELIDIKLENQINITDNRDRFSINQHFEKLDDKQIIHLNSIVKEKNCILNKKEVIVVPNSPHNDDIPLDLSYQSSGFSILNGSRNSFTFDPISPFESEQEPIENCSSNCGERRHRTTLTAMQIQAMKSIFIHCRSPSHNELGTLGNVLSLDMRVVQVWFQNQRAKLKKQERDMFYREKPIFPEATQSIIELPNCDRIHCLVCNQNLNPGISKQVHLFSNDHLIILMRYLVTKSNDMKLNWKAESNPL